MYTVISVIYVAILAIDALLLLVAWGQTRSGRPLVGALLSVLLLLLLLAPTSSLLGFIGRTFTGSVGLYLASALYPQSKEGAITYGMLVSITALIGWIKTPRSVATEHASKRPYHSRRHR